MSDWKPKRFWSAASAQEVEGGWTVHLDARAVKTPAKSALVLPSRALAEAIAREWDAQVEEVDPTTMPLTRSANSAIDKVTPQHAEVAAMLAAYGGTDLLCYRADAQPALADRQAARWDPLLDWAADRYDVRLNTGAGVMHIAQPEHAVARLGAPLFAADAFALAAMHDLIALSGSLVLGLAVSEGHVTPAQGWDLSRLDEDFQAEQWGIDEEAAAQAALKRTAFHDAAAFLTLSRGTFAQ